MKRKCISFLLSIATILSLCTTPFSSVGSIKAEAASALEFKTVEGNVTPPTVKIPTLDTNGDVKYYFGQCGNAFYGLNDKSATEGVWELIDTDCSINGKSYSRSVSGTGGYTTDFQDLLNMVAAIASEFSSLDKEAMGLRDVYSDKYIYSNKIDCTFSGHVENAICWPPSVADCVYGTFSVASYVKKRSIIAIGDILTRSGAGKDRTHVPFVWSGGSGSSLTYGSTNITHGVAPCFYLDLSKIIALFPAGSDVSFVGFNKFDDVTGDYKILINAGDTKSNLNVPSLEGKIITNAYAGQTYDVTYVGASTDVANGGTNYVSAIIYDSDGNPCYYGNLGTVSSTSGTVKLTLPSTGYVAGEEYTLAIFEEEKCDSYKTNYASTPVYSKFVFQEGKPPVDSNTSSSASNITVDDVNNILDPNYEGRVSVDFINEVATFNNTEGYEISYAAIPVNKKTILSHIAANNWEDATGDTEIDLSWVPKTKELALIFRFTQGDDIIYDMLPCKAQEKNLKVGYAVTTSAISIKNVTSPPDFAGNTVGDDDNGCFYFYTLDSKSKAATLVSPASIEWKKGTSGSWTDESVSSIADYLDTYKKKGATLYFRIKSDNRSWPSKEVKFSCKKQANAPTVKVDVSKNTINLKTGQEYRIRLGTDLFSDWISVLKAYGEKIKSVNILDVYTSFTEGSASNAAVTKANLYGASASAISMQVRTEASTKKSTLPSKSTSVTIKAADLGTVEFNGTGTSIKVALKDSDDKTKGIIITNGYTTNFEYAICAKGATPTKFSALKAGKSVTLKPNKYTDASVLVVRVPADKKAGILPSDTAEYQLSNALNPVVEAPTEETLAQETPAQGESTTPEAEK